MKRSRRTVSIALTCPATLVPSSTDGHSHLYLDVPLGWDNAKRVLGVLGDAGVLEKGFVHMSVKRGYCGVRPPWRRKPAMPGGIERHRAAPKVVPGNQPHVMLRTETETLTNGYESWKKEKVAETQVPGQANLITSRLRNDTRHALVLDIDVKSSLTGSAEDGSLVWVVETTCNDRHWNRALQVLGELGIATAVTVALVAEPEPASGPVPAQAEPPGVLHLQSHPGWTSWGWFGPGGSMVVANPAAPDWYPRAGRWLDRPARLPLTYVIPWLVTFLLLVVLPWNHAGSVSLLVGLACFNAAMGVRHVVRRRSVVVRDATHLRSMRQLHSTLGEICTELAGVGSGLDADQVMWEAAGSPGTTQGLVEDALRLRTALRARAEVEAKVEGHLALKAPTRLSVAAESVESDTAARQAMLDEA